MEKKYTGKKYPILRPYRDPNNIDVVFPPAKFDCPEGTCVAFVPALPETQTKKKHRLLDKLLRFFRPQLQRPD